MIADEYKSSSNPISLFDIEIDNTINCIINSFIHTTPKFLNHIKSGSISKQNLNEEELTQEFVALLRREIISLEYSFCVGQEYRDIYNEAKGRTDFYFYPLEESKSTESIFSGEAKRLPSPMPLQREKEYVIGQRQNGGIERFKIEKHGKGLKKSCLIGFIEKNDFNYWSLNINDWIKNLALNDSNWNISEILKSENQNNSYSIYSSLAIRPHDSIFLNHFWITLYN